MRKIKSAMSKTLVVVKEDATFQEATAIFSASGRADLDVVNEAGEFVGVISEGDLIRYAIPNFDQLILGENPSMEEINKLFLQSGRINAKSKITPLIIYDPITLSPEDELLKAAIPMVEKQIRSLPVLSAEGKLVGRLTRADICVALLADDGDV